MIEEMIVVRALLEKSSDADLLRGLRILEKPTPERGASVLPARHAIETIQGSSTRNRGNSAYELPRLKKGCQETSPCRRQPPPTFLGYVPSADGIDSAIQVRIRIPQPVYRSSLGLFDDVARSQEKAWSPDGGNQA
jgi:hypothetical protein